jgi:hypothetical protein
LYRASPRLGYPSGQRLGWLGNVGRSVVLELRGSEMTKEELSDLFDTTMQDFPWSDSVVADLMGAADDGTIETTMDFIRRYCTKKQVSAGLREYLDRIARMNSLFKFV